MSPEPRPHAFEPELLRGERRITVAAALRVITGGTLATLVTFAMTEGLRLAMIVMRASRPSEEGWFVLSGFQQIGWQFTLAAYAVLLVGGVLLRTGANDATTRRWSGAAIVCLASALVSRAILLGGGSIIRDIDWRMVLVHVTSFAETWAVLGTLLAIDMAIRKQAADLGDDALRTASGSHAILVLVLGAGTLLRELLPESHEIGDRTRRIETLMRLLSGAICLAWTFRLTCDARRALLWTASNS